MSKPGSMEYDYSPLRSPCRRCGAMEEEACMPIKPGPHPTILSYHRERGASIGQLVREGYIAYELLSETDPTSKLFLARKPRQAPVERDGWLPAGALSKSIERQDRGGMSGLQQVDPESNGGWGLVPCPEHPDTAAVDCIVCEPVDTESGR